MTTSAHRPRRDAARAALAESDAAADGLLVTHPPNLRWLTGFVGSNSTLLLRADGRDVVATDGRYAEQAAGLGCEVVLDRSDRWVADVAKGLSRLGVEGHVLTWERVRGLEDVLGDRPEIVAAGRLIERLRMTKGDDELAALRRACAITADVLSTLLPRLAPGETEASVARRVEDALRDAGADDRAFPTIVASGPNGARPHHTPGGRELAAGDLVTVDAGALVDGYHADMTRTVAVGEPHPRLREAYDVVQRAQAAGVAAAVAGTPPTEVDRAARDIIAEHGLGEWFVHGTGHGVGLELHELPLLRAESAAAAGWGADVAALPDRSTVTVEPGVYIPDLGGVRIEDTLLVGPHGAEALTPATTDLVICDHSA